MDLAGTAAAAGEPVMVPFGSVIATGTVCETMRPLLQAENGWNWLAGMVLPFSVTASGTSLNAPGNTQRADQVKDDVEILGGIGRGNSYFDPFAFKNVTEARFGTAPFGAVRGPGYANWDLGLFRQFTLHGNTNFQLRLEAFNALNTAHFNNPGTLGVNSMQLNPDVRDIFAFNRRIEAIPVVCVLTPSAWAPARRC